GGSPHEYVHRVQPALIDDRGSRLAVDGIEPAADQRESLVGKIRNGWSEIDPSVEPRLHDMLVRRLNVDEMAGLERPYVARYDLLVDTGLLGGGDEQHHRERRGESAGNARPEPAQEPVVICRPGRELGRCRNALQKRFRCGVAHSIGPQQVAHGLQPLELLAAAFAARDMRFDHRDVRRVQLIVDEPAEQQLLIDARSHYFTLLDCSSADLAAGSNSFARIARPRASRDITVPIGTPVTSAISA